MYIHGKRKESQERKWIGSMYVDTYITSLHMYIYYPWFLCFAWLHEKTVLLFPSRNVAIGIIVSMWGCKREKEIKNTQTSMNSYLQKCDTFFGWTTGTVENWDSKRSDFTPRGRGSTDKYSHKETRAPQSVELYLDSFLGLIPLRLFTLPGTKRDYTRAHSFSSK
jgi:hypothetical protein